MIRPDEKGGRDDSPGPGIFERAWKLRNLNY
jgi:hypothetical protein